MMLDRLDESPATVLLCPRCSSNNLHHESIAVFERAEDERTVLRTRIGDFQNHHATLVDTLDSAEAGNPSERRNGLAINFWCEVCSRDRAGDPRSGDVLTLTLAQHKGASVIKWIFSPLRQAPADESAQNAQP